MAKRAARKPPVPDRLKTRLKALQARLRQTKAQALLLTNPNDIRYLTGFSGEDSWALVPQQGQRVTILSDFRFQQQMEREAPHARAIIRKKGLPDEFQAELKRRRIERVGLQPGHVTLTVRKAIVRKLGARAIAEVDDGLLQQRSVKDRPEINTIRRALSIQQQAFSETAEVIEPGMSEIEVAAELEYRMRRLGAEGTSFPTIVATDANGALPHYQPAKKKLKEGSTLLIDWGARYQGYCSDLTRMLALGRMKRRIREIYQIVHQAQAAAIDALAPGRTHQEVDAAARQVIHRAGYGKQFGHGLGHGIGLDVHEQPALSPRSEGWLEAGQVVTIEPGIYLPGVGGVRIEDDVEVTARGGRVLSDLPKDLSSAII